MPAPSSWMITWIFSGHYNLYKCKWASKFLINLKIWFLFRNELKLHFLLYLAWMILTYLLNMSRTLVAGSLTSLQTGPSLFCIPWKKASWVWYQAASYGEVLVHSEECSHLFIAITPPTNVLHMTLNNLIVRLQ